MSPHTPTPLHDQGLKVEIRLFCLSRLLQAILVLGLVTLPGMTRDWAIHNTMNTMLMSFSYATAALVLLWLSFTRLSGNKQLYIGIGLDLLFANVAIYIIPQSVNLIALILMFPICAAGVLSIHASVAVALLASATLISQNQFRLYANDLLNIERSHFELTLYIAIYLFLAILSYRVFAKLRQSAQLNQAQKLEIDELSALNEKVLQRLPVGVLVIDSAGDITSANQAAERLLMLSQGERHSLSVAAPEVARQLETWDETHAPKSHPPIRLGPDGEEIEPKFLRLPPGEDILVFLESTQSASRRAEGMTLATLGRFSASLAHEVRNPLSAISYSAQLLAESDKLDAMDRSMVNIIQQQVTRTNNVIESVLGLARRQAAQPMPLDLVQMVRDFVVEYTAGFPLNDDTLDIRVPETPVMASTDPSHIHQIVMVLVSNARYYGRMPEQPARMTLAVHAQGNQAVLDVIDRGPGIHENAARRLFQPFYTTSGHGTGLGLYIAHELARANRGNLEYLRRHQGSCFRITLPLVRQDGPTTDAAS